MWFTIQNMIIMMNGDNKLEACMLYDINLEMFGDFYGEGKMKVTKDILNRTVQFRKVLDMDQLQGK